MLLICNGIEAKDNKPCLSYFIALVCILLFVFESLIYKMPLSWQHDVISFFASARLNSHSEFFQVHQLITNPFFSTKASIISILLSSLLVFPAIEAELGKIKFIILMVLSTICTSFLLLALFPSCLFPEISQVILFLLGIYLVDNTLVKINLFYPKLTVIVNRRFSLNLIFIVSFILVLEFIRLFCYDCFMIIPLSLSLTGVVFGIILKSFLPSRKIT